MNTNEINFFLKNTYGFKGIYPCNMIPKVNCRPAIYVINTSPVTPSQIRKKGVIAGEHWVVVALTRSHKAVYFDSFGFPPKEPDIINFVADNSNSLRYNTRMLQNPTSRVCGVYCVDFVLQLSKGVSLRAYISGFKNDLYHNDKEVVERLICLLSTRHRSLKSKLKKLLN